MSNQWICRRCGVELTALNVLVPGVCRTCNDTLSGRVHRNLPSWWHKLGSIPRDAIKAIAGWTLLIAPLAVGPSLLGPVVSETFGAYADWVWLGLFLIYLLFMLLVIEIFHKVRGR
jgi:hypothetical protein